MPRRRTTCHAAGRSEEDWCDSCRRPKLKMKCEYAFGNVGQPSSSPRIGDESPLMYDSTLSAPELSSSRSAANHAGHVFEVRPKLKSPIACEDCVAETYADVELIFTTSRMRAPPMRYTPFDFWRRELPPEPKDRGTQLARAASRNREKEEWLKQIKADSYHEGLRSADELVKQIKEKLQETACELKTVKDARKREAHMASEYKRKVEASKRQKSLTDFFASPLPHDARPRAPPEVLGEGYTERNISSKTFSHHVAAIEGRIIEMSHGDPLKQLQLAAAVNQRMQGIRELRDKDHEAWGYIRNSLKAFFEKLQDRYSGRFPNSIRAAQQAVCTAIANAAPPRKLHVISEAVGVSSERLSEGRLHWAQWVAGDRETLADLRGKIRADSMDEKWIDFAIDIWKSTTRRSERAKDSVRNPRDK